MEIGVGVDLLEGIGAWKSNSRQVGEGLGESGGNGDAGKVNEGEKEDDGGGNSSKICGCGRRCWALAGARWVMNPLANSSKGSLDTALAIDIGDLNGLKNLVITGDFPN